MTQNKDFKKLVRARMRKTGESYTTARQQLLRKRADDAVSRGTTKPAPRPAPASTTPVLDVSKAGMSDTSVQAKTGKTWAEWVAVLDAAGAATMVHRDIAEYLHDREGVADWWSQMVTVGYERIRGLREAGQRRDGAYEVNKSKTFSVPVATLYRAFADARVRARWLPRVALTVRTATQAKSMRITWPDGSNLQLYFLTKDTGRSAVAVQHGKLASRDDADRMRAFWTDRLQALDAVLAPPRTAPSGKVQRTARTATPARRKRPARVTSGGRQGR
jgi:hypothetical protein